MDWIKFNKKTPKFSFENLETSCRIVSLYDGDTIDIILPLIPNEYIGYRFSCRLYGIDTCELKNSNEFLKGISQKSILFLYHQITKNTLPKLPFLELRELIEKDLNDNVYLLKVKCFQFDKYGRILLDIFTDNTTASDLLLENKLAYPYLGKTKMTIEEQIKFFS